MHPGHHGRPAQINTTRYVQSYLKSQK